MTAPLLPFHELTPAEDTLFLAISAQYFALLMSVPISSVLDGPTAHDLATDAAEVAFPSDISMDDFKFAAFSALFLALLADEIADSDFSAAKEADCSAEAFAFSARST